MLDPDPRPTNADLKHQSMRMSKWKYFHCWHLSPISLAIWLNNLSTYVQCNPSLQLVEHYEKLHRKGHNFAMRDKSNGLVPWLSADKESIKFVFGQHWSILSNESIRELLDIISIYQRRGLEDWPVVKLGFCAGAEKDLFNEPMILFWTRLRLRV